MHNTCVCVCIKICNMYFCGFKGVSFMNQNTSDLENVEGNMPESKSFVKDKVDSVQERRVCTCV